MFALPFENTSPGIFEKSDLREEKRVEIFLFGIVKTKQKAIFALAFETKVSQFSIKIEIKFFEMM